MRIDDRTYFIRRAREERAAAGAASCPKAAAAHRELAELHADLAAGHADQPAEASRPAKAEGRLGSRAPLRKCR